MYRLKIVIGFLLVLGGIMMSCHGIKNHDNAAIIIGFFIYFTNAVVLMFALRHKF